MFNKYFMGFFTLAVLTDTDAGGFVSIGPSSDCDFDTSIGATLQDAINAPETEVRLVDSTVYLGTFTANSSITLRGGFSSCQDANNNNQFVNHSVINGNQLDSTLILSGNGNYILEQIELTNGLAPNMGGGGLRLTGVGMFVTLDQVVIKGNEAKSGGGLAKTGGAIADVYIVDSIIEENVATYNSGGGKGGGVFFRGFGKLNVAGNTAITNNSAMLGGGIYLEEAEAALVAGDNSNINQGITFNKADDDGGGLYATNAFVEITGGLYDMGSLGIQGNLNEPFNIMFNESDANVSGLGSGAGLSATTGAELNLAAVHIAFNQSNKSAGGVYATNGAKVTFKRSLYPALNNNCAQTVVIGCNVLVGNTASDVGGAIYLASGADGIFDAVNFNANRADLATVAFVTGLGSQLLIENSVMADNGEGGVVSFADQHVVQANDDGVLILNHVTAIENNATQAFIHNNGASVFSYYSYLFNLNTGPWITENGVSNSDAVCLVVDDVNNQSITGGFIFAIPFSNHSTYFVDLPNRNLHLTDLPNDLIDLPSAIGCPSNPLGSSSKDIDGEPREASVDLGADENLVTDIIFKNGFSLSIDIK